VNDKKSNGMLHFYKVNGKWEYVTADEYEEKKSTLPDLCFVTKCPIEDLENKEWPDLD
jgi:hypothetical protein